MRRAAFALLWLAVGAGCGLNAPGAQPGDLVREIPLAAGGIAVAPGGDLFVISAGVTRIGPDGAARWTAQLGSVTALAPAPSGDLFVGGTAVGAAGVPDLYLGRIAGADGATQWERQFTTAPMANNRLDGVRASPDGDVVIFGGFYDGVDLGGGLLPGAGFFFARYGGEDGAFQWARVATIPALIATFAFAPDGALVLVGTVDGPVDLGGGPLDDEVGGDRVPVLARYAPDGALLAVTVTSHEFTSLAPFAIDAVGDLYFAPPYGLDDDPRTVLVRTTPDGDIVWRRSAGGGPGRVTPLGMALDPSAGLVLVGSFTGTLDLGDAGVTDGVWASFTAAGALEAAGPGDEGFIARFTLDGDPVWSRSGGGGPLGTVALDAGGAAYVAASRWTETPAGGFLQGFIAVRR